MCQIKSVRVGHKEQFGTSTCGLRPHKLCADAHIYNCAGNLCGSSFDPHHLSIAKMSSSVQIKSRRRGSFSNDNTECNRCTYLKCFTKTVKIKGRRPKWLVLIQFLHFLPQLRLQILSAHCMLDRAHGWT